MTWRRAPLSNFLSFRRLQRNMSTRNFDDAIEKLNSLQSNFAAVEASRASGGRIVQFAKHETAEYLARIGYSLDDLNRLNVIHITGTKGKGSTCAFVDSILRSNLPNRKVGLFTSPHLVSVRERIRINGAPISEQDFVRFFYEVWDRLEANDTRKYDSTPAKPMYFKYLNLVAYHAFLTMEVDTAILEVGIGGEYDSTNAVPKPIVTGITSLGLDHILVLGKTLGEIAWQKGGIYKEGVPAFTVEQPSEALEVLRNRAQEKNSSSFEVVPVRPELRSIKLGLAGTHQLQNASLALRLVHAYLRAQSQEPKDGQDEPIQLSKADIEGLEQAKWPGRCQTVLDPKDERSTWFLDGAHTVESLVCCGDWFVSPGLGLKEKTTRILVFNCTHGRSGQSLLTALRTIIQIKIKEHNSPIDPDKLFDHVIFCTNITYADGTSKGEFTEKAIDQKDLAQLKTQTDLARAWEELNTTFPQDHIHVVPSIEHAVKTVRDIRETTGGPVDTLVAGSLLLVGGLIEVAGLAKAALEV